MSEFDGGRFTLYIYIYIYKFTYMFMYVGGAVHYLYVGWVGVLQNMYLNTGTLKVLKLIYRIF